MSNDKIVGHTLHIKVFYGPFELLGDGKFGQRPCGLAWRDADGAIHRSGRTPSIEQLQSLKYPTSHPEAMVK